MNLLTASQIDTMRALPVKDVIKFWDELEAIGKRKNTLAPVVRFLVQNDLYYLLVRVCGRVDLLPCVGRLGYIDNQFAFDRCREVERDPNGYVDLWAREHWKTTILTFGKTLQDICIDPEVTIGIFSHTRPIAKAFLRMLMREIENNKTLSFAFPDIFCGSDIRQYQKFSEDDGVIVKRKSNPNESTIEAWGLVDGMPVSKHWSVLDYDDIVVPGSVTTPEMIDKTRNALELSYNLGTTTGVRRMAGTRYHFNDAYKTVIDRGTFKRREYPGRVGGVEDGESIVWSDEIHIEKRKSQGPYNYAAQILLNPAADVMQGFRREWLRHWKTITPAQWKKMNRYLLVDAASSKKKGSDYTAMGVIGLNVDGTYMVLDIVRDRLNLAERAQRLFDLHRRWEIKKPVRYERYGMMGDIEHIKDKQERENYRFDIREVGGQTPKNDRIKRLLPIFEQGRFWLPTTLHVTDYQKQSHDLVRDFVEDEYIAFPVGAHDDMLDMFARIAEPDMQIDWPKAEKIVREAPRKSYGASSWMAS